MSKRSIKLGTVYEVKTFAGPVVHIKITDKSQIEGVYIGVHTRQSDIVALKDAGVCYTGSECPAECPGYVYDYQIIKRVNKKRIDQKRSGGVIRRKRKK
ncbi:hypothetical protein CMI47_19470 [Candidatus Pacearchaeota archaeon]|nr:hypothetical protein [Candidatus Pacearchaeota archaeon]|tara:strand:+ start:5619 stop:5915 length:297 start_codon:yes stop_codon:yes gene_type:complete